MSAILRRTDGSIDWEAIRSKLRSVESTFRSDQLSAEKSQAILQARASRLAEVPEQPPNMQEIFQLLSFQLGDETFGIETKYVHEVVRHCQLVRIPDVPSFVAGVTNLRGEILAVMDLRQLFDIVSPEEHRERQVIVVGVERMEFGVLTDSVHEVFSKKIADVLAVPRSIGATARRYLRGVTADAGLILDGAALLDSADFYIDLGE